MGLTDEQVDTIIEAHTDTVDGLKGDITRYKADAEKLPGVQRELDDLKAAGDGGYKDKYEREHSDFETYKAAVSAREAKAAKERAVKAYFESKNIVGANLELAMRGCGEELAALELDGDKIKDARSLDALIEGVFRPLVSTVQTMGANTAAPPAKPDGKSYTAADERFEGAVWALAVPPAVIALAGEITEWQEKNGEAVLSPYTSESFGGYSYTRATDAATGGLAGRAE